jgi:hypothetical protein
VTRISGILCWIMAVSYGCLSILDLFLSATRTQQGIDGVTAAVWFVGAILIDEAQKWRRM